MPEIPHPDNISYVENSTEEPLQISRRTAELSAPLKECSTSHCFKLLSDTFKAISTGLNTKHYEEMVDTIKVTNKGANQNKHFTKFESKNSELSMKSCRDVKPLRSLKEFDVEKLNELLPFSQNDDKPIDNIFKNTKSTLYHTSSESVSILPNAQVPNSLSRRALPNLRSKSFILTEGRPLRGLMRKYRNSNKHLCSKSCTDNKIITHSKKSPFDLTKLRYLTIEDIFNLIRNKKEFVSNKNYTNSPVDEPSLPNLSKNFKEPVVYHKNVDERNVKKSDSFKRSAFTARKLINDLNKMNVTSNNTEHILKHLQEVKERVIELKSKFNNKNQESLAALREIKQPSKDLLQSIKFNSEVPSHGNILISTNNFTQSKSKERLEVSSKNSKTIDDPNAIKKFLLNLKKIMGTPSSKKQLIKELEHVVIKSDSAKCTNAKNLVKLLEYMYSVVFKNDPEKKKSQSDFITIKKPKVKSILKRKRNKPLLTELTGFEEPEGHNFGDARIKGADYVVQQAFIDLISEKEPKSAATSPGDQINNGKIKQKNKLGMRQKKDDQNPRVITQEDTDDDLRRPSTYPLNSTKQNAFTKLSAEESDFKKLNNLLKKILLSSAENEEENVGTNEMATKAYRSKCRSLLRDVEKLCIKRPNTAYSNKRVEPHLNELELPLTLPTETIPNHRDEKFSETNTNKLRSNNPDRRSTRKIKDSFVSVKDLEEITLERYQNTPVKNKEDVKTNVRQQFQTKNTQNIKKPKSLENIMKIPKNYLDNKNINEVNNTPECLKIRNVPENKHQNRSFLFTNEIIEQTNDLNKITKRNGRSYKQTEEPTNADLRTEKRRCKKGIEVKAGINDNDKSPAQQKKTENKIRSKKKNDESVNARTKNNQCDGAISVNCSREKTTNPSTKKNIKNRQSTQSKISGKENKIKRSSNPVLETTILNQSGQIKDQHATTTSLDNEEIFDFSILRKRKNQPDKKDVLNVSGHKSDAQSQMNSNTKKSANIKNKCPNSKAIRGKDNKKKSAGILNFFKFCKNNTADLIADSKIVRSFENENTSNANENSEKRPPSASKIKDRKNLNIGDVDIVGTKAASAESLPKTIATKLVEKFANSLKNSKERTEKEAESQRKKMKQIIRVPDPSEAEKAKNISLLSKQLDEKINDNVEIKKTKRLKSPKRKIRTAEKKNDNANRGEKIKTKEYAETNKNKLPSGTPTLKVSNKQKQFTTEPDVIKGRRKLLIDHITGQIEKLAEEAIGTHVAKSETQMNQQHSNNMVKTSPNTFRVNVTKKNHSENVKQITQCV